MRFKVGDKVRVLSYEITGTIVDKYKYVNNVYMFIVKPDTPESLRKLIPKERISTEKLLDPNTVVEASVNTTADDLLLLSGPKSDPKWVDIWDKNST